MEESTEVCRKFDDWLVLK